MEGSHYDSLSDVEKQQLQDPNNNFPYGVSWADV
jgi:hypothetical protein